MYVPPQKVWFLNRFDLKTEIPVHFAHFGMELGMVFEGTMQDLDLVYECICHILIPNE